MTEITDPDHIIAKDMARRANELHERWFNDVTDLCIAANLSHQITMQIVVGQMMRAAARALALSNANPDEGGRAFAEALRGAKVEIAEWRRVAKSEGATRDR